MENQWASWNERMRRRSKTRKISLKLDQFPCENATNEEFFFVSQLDDGKKQA